MKKFITRFFLFIFITILIFPFVTIFTELVKPESFFLRIRDLKGKSSFTWTKLREVDKITNVDVLILGSSMVYRGIDTRAFDTLGIKTFNFGTSAQTPIQTEYLVEKYIDKINPKLIIWDISPNSLTDSGFESFIDLCSNDGVNKEMIDQFFHLKRFDAVSTLVAVGIKRLFFPKNDFEEELIKGKDKYIEGGFVERKIEKSGYNPSINPIYFYPKQNQIQAIERILKKFNEKQIPTILVAAPIHPDRYRTYENLDYFRQLRSSWSRKFEIVDVFDFNNLKLHPNLFYDMYHLNQHGVVFYNNELIYNVKPYLCF
ncbi:hypothetical protein [Algoriphagus sp. CAU 1675]|uniref:hypothetical protein n=1 Tax=Algoriphagus sp. CAU 1675 TaxID=3032597 RepID=UPI0023DAC965|nr:hypothetical protein [Algoriphagus sp. CAU 1675]MDF2159410.1 hypothetical protein [Algoriphagus sp. CAU 1675]